MKVILNIAKHGDEKIGLRVAQKIKKLNIRNGELLINVANERALKLGKRFVDQDLNRSFPGNPKGNHEERRAHELLPIIKSADIVIDIHSTTSDLKDSLIVTKLDKKTRMYTRVIAPKYVLLMNATKHNALISNARIGIAFEYGGDNNPKAIKNTELGIKRLLVKLNMIKKGSFVDTEEKIKPTYFDVYKSVPKPSGAVLNKKIKNFVLVKKGQIYATVSDLPIVAEEDFYPILFGEKKYENIFGFAGRKGNYIQSYPKSN